MRLGHMFNLVLFCVSPYVLMLTSTHSGRIFLRYRKLMMADQAIPTNAIVTMNQPRKRKRTATAGSGPKEPKVRPIECPVCSTNRSPKLIHTVSACGCTYCTYCIREMFSVSLQMDSGIYWRPAMCCDHVLDYDLFETCLTPQLRRAYKSRTEENATGDPLYCGNNKCGQYILATSVKDGFGCCGKCKAKTCVKRGCNRPRAEHLGVHAICPGKLETDELRKLAEEKGWKRCPKCFALTELSRGCNDIR